MLTFGPKCLFWSQCSGHSVPICIPDQCLLLTKSMGKISSRNERENSIIKLCSNSSFPFELNILFTSILDR